MDKELPLNIDLLTSRMLTSLAHLIEGTEDVCLLLSAGTYVEPKQPTYNEFFTHFDFTMMTGRLDSFETFVTCDSKLKHKYFYRLTKENAVRKTMQHIVESLLPPCSSVVTFDVTVEVGNTVDASLRWRTPTWEYENVGLVHNQIPDPNNVKTIWNNLRFRSHSEMRVAIALDAAGVLFLPNCLGRLNGSEGRKNLECDFLVCDEGKWGILEVDGAPYHPPSRTVQDHERDRLFKAHGILVVEHFDARECFENAKGVVQKFLAILRKS